MENKLDDFKNLGRNFEDFDNELNTFFQSLKEIKEIRETVAALPDNLKKGEIEIGHQKKELEQLIFNTNNLLRSFEEKTKGLFYDLEQKVETIVNDVKSNISQLSSDLSPKKFELKDEQIRTREQISKEFVRMITFHETVKKFEFSLKVNKKYIYGLEKRIRREEEELKSRLEKQKKFILALTITFIVGILFVVLYFK